MAQRGSKVNRFDQLKVKNLLTVDSFLYLHEKSTDSTDKLYPKVATVYNKKVKSFLERKIALEGYKPGMLKSDLLNGLDSEICRRFDEERTGPSYSEARWQADQQHLF